MTSSWWQKVKDTPSALLLAVQLGAVLIYPFLEDAPGGRAIFSMFGIIVLGIPATVLLLIQAITGSDDLLAYSSAFEAVLYFYAAGAMVAYMLADHTVTRDELFAVGATFTLVAWAFAYTYIVIQAVSPDSFTAAVNPGDDRTWTELLFLSFTTLSSTGLSDVIPIRPFARGLVMVEQLAGLAYVAILVSRVVGLTVLRPHDPTPRDQQD